MWRAKCVQLDNSTLICSIHSFFQLPAVDCVHFGKYWLLCWKLAIKTSSFLSSYAYEAKKTSIMFSWFLSIFAHLFTLPLRWSAIAHNIWCICTCFHRNLVSTDYVHIACTPIGKWFVTNAFIEKYFDKRTAWNVTKLNKYTLTHIVMEENMEKTINYLICTLEYKWYRWIDVAWRACICWSNWNRISIPIYSKCA